MFVVQGRDAKTLIPIIINKLNNKTEKFQMNGLPIKKYQSMDLNILQ